ncbi:hypothetical protein L195_g033784, partial [Trifolium pratense]
LLGHEAQNGGRLLELAHDAPVPAPHAQVAVYMCCCVVVQPQEEKM